MCNAFTRFPGMNPYLERKSVWHDFHDVFCMECRKALLPLIRPDFIATLDDNVYIHELSAEETHLLGRGDVSIVEKPDAGVIASSSSMVVAPVTGQVLPRVDIA